MGRILVLLFLAFIGFPSLAQKNCGNKQYFEQAFRTDPQLQHRLNSIENFISGRISVTETQRINPLTDIITIPVVFHVLYHTVEQNIGRDAIDIMLNALNRDFNKRNSDTVNTPVAFKPFAASMGFEFKIATSDPQGRSTSGILRKYTPVQYWLSDDQMKFSSSYGDDGWDSKNYLNIWICNLKDVLGYSTLPGMDPEKDGIVISFEDIKNRRRTTPTVNDSRTIVHEVGHWLNLYHIWGDSYCGDDKVNDTPKQGTYTPGCPNGTRISCTNNTTGDMYMNFMDFTDDVCVNMFTNGQRQRARALFDSGGPRYSILLSKGLDISSIEPAAMPDFYPKWYNANVYPNPATSFINIYFDYDERWIGRRLEIRDISGKIAMSITINSRIQRIDIGKLSAGIYFIHAKKDNEKLNGKFVKL